jgi:hypothetical protein
MSDPTPLETLRAAASAAHNRDPLANSPKADPSGRDLQIFKMVAIERCTHAQAAKRFDITRSRVTQVIKQVRDALAQAGPHDQEVAAQLARQRLQTQLQQQRLEHVLDISARALRSQPKPLRTTKTGHRTKAGDKEEWTETTTREQPVSMQALKTYLRATEALGKLSHVGWLKRSAGPRASAANPDQEKLTQEELFQSVQLVLHDWIRRLHKEPNQPNDTFIAMVQHFQWCLFSWLYHRRQGSPASQIVLPPFPSNDDAKAPVPAPNLDPIPDPTLAPAPTPSAPNLPNHPDPEPNQRLTSDDFFDPDPTSDPETTSNAPDSFPYDQDPTVPLPKKSEKVSASEHPPHAPRSSSPEDSDSFEARLRRRLAHDRKLELFREANRHGLPIQLEFDPADGPLPELSGHLDDYGYIPTPPNKEDEVQMVKDYLAKLRAECRANA